jgi:nucleotide-binding universal stress UspA family protein
VRREGDNVSVVLVGHGLRSVVRAVLVATDGGAAAARALEVAIEIARDSGASLDVLSVGSPPRDTRAGASIPDADEITDPWRIAGDAASRAQDGGVRASAHAARGDVVRCIANAARTFDVGLIVVGSRARGAALGSVSQALVHHSPVSVTVVHDPGNGDAGNPRPLRTSYVREARLRDWSMFE